MSLDDFWHGDMRLLNVYQKAYLRDRDYSAWANGQYANIAFSVVMANAFSKKGQSKAEYPKYSDPIDKIEVSVTQLQGHGLEEPPVSKGTPVV